MLVAFKRGIRSSNKHTNKKINRFLMMAMYVIIDIDTLKNKKITYLLGWVYNNR